MTDEEIIRSITGEDLLAIYEANKNNRLAPKWKEELLKRLKEYDIDHEESQI